jgi:ABC-type multidrug transport system ATPase subunit
LKNTLDLRSLSFLYGKKNILENINFTCTEGEILGIFGRNGSGKSTLFKLIFGSLRPKTGEILFNNKPISKKSGFNENIGYHHQDIFLPKNTKVRNLIPLYFPNGDDQNKIFYDSQIAKIEKEKVGALSLGEQKYLQFLLVVNLNHDFILLDEPFTMVEPLYVAAMKEKIMQYKGQKGFIITDHYYLDVLDIATKKMIIKDKCIIQILEQDELVQLNYLPPKFI